VHFSSKWSGSRSLNGRQRPRLTPKKASAPQSRLTQRKKRKKKLPPGSRLVGRPVDFYLSNFRLVVTDGNALHCVALDGISMSPCIITTIKRTSVGDAAYAMSHAAADACTRRLAAGRVDGYQATDQLAAANGRCVIFSFFGTMQSDWLEGTSLKLFTFFAWS